MGYRLSQNFSPTNHCIHQLLAKGYSRFTACVHKLILEKLVQRFQQNLEDVDDL